MAELQQILKRGRTMRENKFGGGLLLQMVRFLRNDDIPSGTSSQLVSNRMVSWGTAICDIVSLASYT